ncbi:MAG: hypothetical protein IKE50_05210 [Erysipelotrichaceae bacterium]|nr:hypothetical protein [Erysipelotrichaceae bacterium]
MDAFILALRDLCKDLLPSLGAASLVCLIVLLIKLIRVMDSVDATLLKTHGTIDLVDKSIEKVQAPLDTAVKVSGTVDRAHDATLEAVKDAKEFVAKSAGEVKERISEIMKESSKETDELKEPSPEDIIGG